MSSVVVVERAPPSFSPSFFKRELTAYVFI